MPGHCVCSLQAPVVSRWRALLFDSCCVLRACLASQPLRHARVGVLFLVQLRPQRDASEGEEHTVEGKSLEGYCFESMPPAIVNDTMGYFAARSLEGECIESMPPAIGNNTMDYFAARWCRVRTDERGRNHGC